MQSKHLYPLLFLLLLQCNSERTYYYEKNSTEFITQLRIQNYYEYSGPFNSAMQNQLKAYDASVINSTSLNTVFDVSQIVAEQKNVIGSYVIYWQKDPINSASENYILMEWNPNSGVIIRMFTQLEELYRHLPSTTL
jgi:hypothetical protein